MRRSIDLGTALLVGLFLGGCNLSGSVERSVKVFVAASVTDAFEGIREAFERQTGVTVKVNYAGSSTLAKQILSGAEPDLFISANQAWVDVIEQEKHVEKRLDLLGNQLVIIVRTDSDFRPVCVDDLLSENVQRISVADPESVPAGIYAKQALTKLGHWSHVEPKIIIGADVRHALAHVQSGGAQAGIVYATDAAISKAVKVTGEINTELTEPIIYPLVITPKGAANADAQQLFEFIRSDDAATTFQKFGFVTQEVKL